MPVNKQKYLQYIQIKSDPALALMRIIKDHEKEMEEYMAACDKKMEKMMEEKMESIIAKMEQKEPMHADFIQKIVNQAVSQVIGNAKGEKGDRGEVGVQGESIIGPQGERGPQGPVGISGAIGERGLAGKDGKNGINGNTPVKGIDYFTPKEISEFVNKVKDLINMEEILKKLEEIIKEIANLKKEKQQLGQLGGQRTLHRGGIDLRWNENVGTGNGSTTAFDLDFTPYSSSELQVWIGGGIQFLTDDFTLSGKTLTFLIAPPSGAVIRATYRRA